MRGVHQRVLPVSLSFMGLLTLGCSEGPIEAPRKWGTDAALAKGGGGTPATVTVIPTSPGLNPTPDNVYSVTIPDGGYLEIRPACSSSDRLDLQGMGAAFDALGARSTCNGNAGAGFMFLKLFAHLDMTVDPTGIIPTACPDQDTPNGTNFGVASRYFFQVDGSDADSKFDDTQYTLVLTDCNVWGVPGQSTWRRVTATVGNLYEGQTTTIKPGFAGIGVNVDVTMKP